jgi:hypothetical protein
VGVGGVGFASFLVVNQKKKRGRGGCVVEREMKRRRSMWCELVDGC